MALPNHLQLTLFVPLPLPGPGSTPAMYTDNLGERLHVAFLNSYVQNKDSTWVGEMENLSEIAITQPQAAYTVFTHVFLHRWSYIARTVPFTPELFHPLDDVLSLHFLPAILKKILFSSGPNCTPFHPHVSMEKKLEEQHKKGKERIYLQKRHLKEPTEAQGMLVNW